MSLTTYSVPASYGTMDDLNSNALVIDMSENALALKPSVKDYFEKTFDKINELAQNIAQQQTDIFRRKEILEGQWPFFLAKHRFKIFSAVMGAIAFTGFCLIIAAFTDNDNNKFQAGAMMFFGGTMTWIVGYRVIVGFGPNDPASCRPKILKDAEFTPDRQEVKERWSNHAEVAHVMNQLADFHENIQEFKAKPDSYGTKQIFDHLDDLLNQVHKHTSNIPKDYCKVILLDQIIKFLPDTDLTLEWNLVISSSNADKLQNFSLWKRLGIKEPNKNDCEAFFKNYSQNKNVTKFIDSQIAAYLDAQLLDAKRKDITLEV